MDIIWYLNYFPQYCKRSSFLTLCGVKFLFFIIVCAKNRSYYFQLTVLNSRNVLCTIAINLRCVGLIVLGNLIYEMFTNLLWLLFLIFMLCKVGYNVKEKRWIKESRGSQRSKKFSMVTKSVHKKICRRS